MNCKSLFFLVCVLSVVVFASSLVTIAGSRRGRCITRRAKLYCTTATSGPALSNKAYSGIIGSFKVIAEELEGDGAERELESRTIRLLDVGSGWGNGAHPTTRLCLDFVAKTVKTGDLFLDYGTGSGILSIAAAKLGASHCVAVDIDEDTLRAAEKNAEVNGVAEKLDVVHTKYVYIGEDRFPICDVTVANILPGPLTRLVAPLWGFTKAGGIMCLSGMRPHELPAIREAYRPFVEVDTEEINQESHEMYGDWVSWSVRTKVMTVEQRREAMALLTDKAMNN